MVARLLKYGVFAAMCAIWLIVQVRKRRAGIKPDKEKAKAVFEATVEGVFGTTDEEKASQ